MQIEANDLFIFAKVADSGSFSRTAEQLGLPKSTISRRVAALENQLGERLLQRTTRKLVLTDFGLALLEHARQVSAEVDAAIALAQHRQFQPSGVLRISMPNDFANQVLADLLPAFAERYPAIRLELDLSARRVDVLGEGFDLAIRIGDLPDDASLTAKRIYRVNSGLYASPAYLAKRGEPHTPDDLMQHDSLRLLRGSRETVPWELVCGDQQWKGNPPVRASVNSPELLLTVARQGLGIVAAPTDFIKALIASGELLAVLPEWCPPSVNAWAVFPSRKLMPGKTRVFIDLLEALLPQV